MLVTWETSISKIWQRHAAEMAGDMWLELSANSRSWAFPQLTTNDCKEMDPVKMSLKVGLSLVKPPNDGTTTQHLDISLMILWTERTQLKHARFLSYRNCETIHFCSFELLNMGCLFHSHRKLTQPGYNFFFGSNCWGYWSLNAMVPSFLPELRLAKTFLFYFFFFYLSLGINL